MKKKFRYFGVIFVTLALFSLLWHLFLVYPWKGKVHNYIFEIVSGFAEKVPTSVFPPNFQTSYVPTCAIEIYCFQEIRISHNIEIFYFFIGFCFT